MFEQFASSEQAFGRLRTVSVVLPVRGDRPSVVEIGNPSDSPLYLQGVALSPADSSDGDVGLLGGMDLFMLSGNASDLVKVAENAAKIRQYAVAPRGSRVGIAVNWPFLGSSLDQMKHTLELVSELADQLGMPFNVKLSSDWGGWPIRAPDGAGGHFGNLVYQQIVWSPETRTESSDLKDLLGYRYHPGYGLTVPNVWSNTPWLTYNHPRLNAFLQDQYRNAGSAVSWLRDVLRRSGRSGEFAPISVGSETLYWARENGRGAADQGYTRYNQGVPRLTVWGDFNPATVAAAAKDGVTLDPTDGLSPNERLWLHENLNRYTQMLVSALNSGLASEDKGRFFTEPYAYPYYPLWSDAHPVLEVGVVNGAYSGGQWYTSAILPQIVQQRQFGPIANPNFEWTGILSALDALSAVRAAYALGCEFVTFYNYQNDEKRFFAMLERYASEWPVAWTFDTTWLSEGKASGGSTQNELLNEMIFKPNESVQLVNRIDLLPISDLKPVSTNGIQVSIYRQDLFDETPIITARYLLDQLTPTGDGWISAYVPALWLDPTFTYRMVVSDWSPDARHGANHQGQQSGSWAAARIGLDMVRERGISRIIQTMAENS
ncbi:MAG: hypothetical protein ACM3VX_02650 [Bacteroidota bacterium]